VNTIQNLTKKLRGLNSCNPRFSRGFLDVKSWLGPHLNPLFDHTFPHLFRFRRTINGEVIFETKNLSSDPHWTPVPGGPLLASLPEGEPSLIRPDQSEMEKFLGRLNSMQLSQEEVFFCLSFLHLPESKADPGNKERKRKRRKLFRIFLSCFVIPRGICGEVLQRKQKKATNLPGLFKNFPPFMKGPKKTLISEDPNFLFSKPIRLRFPASLTLEGIELEIARTDLHMEILLLPRTRTEPLWWDVF